MRGFYYLRSAKRHIKSQKAFVASQSSKLKDKRLTKATSSHPYGAWALVVFDKIVGIAALRRMSLSLVTHALSMYTIINTKY